jgi:hypothetical protein
MDSIVVMESGAHWPAWVDREAGAVSNVVILAKQRDESRAEFEARAGQRLGQVAELGSPKRGILVCGPGGRDATSCRKGLLRALIEVVRRAGGGEVVCVGERDRAWSDELVAHLRKLNQRDREGSGLVRLRFRRPEPASVQPAARVA